MAVGMTGAGGSPLTEGLPALAAFIEERLRRSRIPGCSVAVVDADARLWAQGFGLADLASGRAATPDTVYHLFSGTKLFTAVAVLQMAEQGLVDIEAPISHYLPDYPELRRVTVTHLLSHQSGLRDRLRGFLAVYLPGQQAPSTAEALAAYRVRPGQAPGTRVQYRNVNYALLGELISRLHGRPYREVLRERVLLPLGAGLDFELSEATRPHAASGYVDRWDPMRLALYLLFPALRGQLYGRRTRGHVALREFGLASSAIGGLRGSVRDFSVFLHSQLGGAQRLLGAHWVARMQSLAARGQAGIVSADGVGLGWKLGHSAAGRFLNHEGGGAGFTTELRLYPDRGLGIALAMNTMRMPQTMKLAHELCEALVAARGPWSRQARSLSAVCAIPQE